jgi:nitrate reductase NapE component
MTTNEWLVTVLIVFACIAVTVGLYFIIVWIFTYLFKSKQNALDNSGRKKHDS